MKPIEQFYQSIVDSVTSEVEQRVLQHLNNLSLNDKTLEINEAAEYTRISEKLLYRLCKEKRIPHIRAGVSGSRKPKIIFRQSSLDIWMREQEKQNYQAVKD